MTDTPRPGDKVKVSYETRVDSDGTYYGQSIRGGIVEILERADHPSSDPIGTVRDPSGSNELLIKVRPDFWYCLARAEGPPLRFSDENVENYPRVPLSQIEKVFGPGRP